MCTDPKTDRLKFFFVNYFGVNRGIKWIYIFISKKTHLSGQDALEKVKKKNTPPMFSTLVYKTPSNKSLHFLYIEVYLSTKLCHQLGTLFSIFTMFPISLATVSGNKFSHPSSSYIV